MRGSILLTDGNYKHTIGMSRALAAAGYVVDVAGGPNCASAWSRYVREGVLTSRPLSDLPRGEIEALLSEREYLAVLPVGAASVAFVSENRDWISQWAGLALPSKAAIRVSMDKSSTGELAKRLGIRVPRQVVIDSAGVSPVPAIDMDFPLVVKSAWERTNISVGYANRQEDLPEAVSRARAWSLPGEPILVQEKIFGPGMGYFAAFQGGVCKREFMHERIRENPPSGGASSCAQSIYRSDLRLQGRAILEDLGWNGVAMVEFKMDETTGELVLMEINPKFWGSLELAIWCGVNFPVAAAEIAGGGEVDFERAPRKSRRYQWPLDGDLQHCIGRPASLPRALGDLLDPRVGNNLHLDDPGPTLNYAVRQLARRTPKVGFGGAVLRLGIRSGQDGWRVSAIRGLAESTGIPSRCQSRLTPCVMVGAQQSKVGARRLRGWGVTATLSLRATTDDADTGRAVGRYLRIPVPEYEAPTVAQLLEGCRFIDESVQGGGKVYIHCREGVSRAPTMAVAWLISQGLTLEQAMQQMRTARPFLRVLPSQHAVLCEFEAKSLNAL